MVRKGLKALYGKKIKINNSKKNRGFLCLFFFGLGFLGGFFVANPGHISFERSLRVHSEIDSISLYHDIQTNNVALFLS